MHSTRKTTHNGERETKLVKRAVDGDPDAFAGLYDIYVDRIYRFIVFRVDDEGTAEDFTSQVFLKAWEALDSYETRGAPFGAWLFRIARNLVIDHYRTQKEVAPLDAVVESQPAPVAGVHTEVERRLVAEELHDALQQLTDLQREVLTLKFIGGLETREVAQVMDRRQGAIRALQMRGLRALEDVLKAQDMYD